MYLDDLTTRFCRYCAVEEGLAVTTVHGFKGTLKLVAKRTGVKTLDELTLDVLREFLYECKEKYQCGYSSISNHMKYLKKFFQWCIEKGYCRENPVLQMKMPKKPKSLPRVLTKEEARQILCIAFSYDWFYTFERQRNYAIIATLLFTGIRADELLNLRMEDVNLNSERFFIREGKGKKQRYVPMHRRLKNILSNYLDERKRLKKRSEFFFVGAQSDLQLGYKYLAQVCNRISIEARIKFTPHVLRHTAATEMLNEGIDIYKVSKILGHSDIKTTTIYLHTATGNLQKSLNAVDLY